MRTFSKLVGRGLIHGERLGIDNHAVLVCRRLYRDIALPYVLADILNGS